MKALILPVLVNIAITSGAKSISNIEYLSANRNQVEVTKIEYADDATTVSFITKKDCCSTLKVGHGIYIVDDNGERHHAIGTKGIKLDSLYVLFKDKRFRFSIYFAPVEESNKALDVRDPCIFSIFGLHDAKMELNIPKAKGEIDEQEVGNSLYRTQSTEVEGVVRDYNDSFGKIMYCGYISPRLESRLDKYSDIDATGHFGMQFSMYSPFQLYLGKGEYVFVQSVIYARPGDKIRVELYDELEGKEFVYSNLSGHKAYNKLVNCPGSIPNASKCRPNLSSLDYYKDKAYIEKEYERSLKLADYICLHYDLSPFEIELYLDNIHLFYAHALMSINQLIDREYEYAETEEDKEKYASILVNQDYSFLKNINPNNPAYISNSTFDILCSQIIRIKSMRKIVENVPKTDKNRWEKIINLQNEELNRITGWSGMTFVMQLAVVEGINDIYTYNNQPQDDSDKSLEQVKFELTHPYCKMILDYYYKEIKAGYNK